MRSKQPGLPGPSAEDRPQGTLVMEAHLCCDKQWAHGGWWLRHDLPELLELGTVGGAHSLQLSGSALTGLTDSPVLNVDTALCTEPHVLPFLDTQHPVAAVAAGLCPQTVIFLSDSRELEEARCLSHRAEDTWEHAH